MRNVALVVAGSMVAAMLGYLLSSFVPLGWFNDGDGLGATTIIPALAAASAAVVLGRQLKNRGRG